MNRRLHQVIGWSLLAVYLYVIFHRSRLLPGLTPGAYPTATFRNAGGGYAVAYGLPVIAIICFLWPKQLMWHLSPRTPPSYDYLLTEGFWYSLGYVLLLVGIGVLGLFRSSTG